MGEAMASEYGFIYVLCNESMPGIYKIGFTMGHPKARMEQLSSATACPTPFEMLACFGTEDPRQVEQAIHGHLRHFRVNSSREFFQCELSLLEGVLWEYTSEEDLMNTRALESASFLEKRERDQQWKLSYFLSQNADPIHWPEHIEIPFD